MQDDPSSGGPTLTADSAPSSSREVALVVMEQRALARHPLVGKRVMQIGRAEDCDVVLRDPAASRRHALLHVGPELEIEDLASRNGTRVRNVPLPPGQRVRLSVGDSVHIGDAILILQGSARSAVTNLASLDGPSGRSAIVIDDPGMRAAYELVERVAPSGITVLIFGETGVGKELIAESVHRASGERARGPFLRINCAALTESLFESELFGHERGAFTGAQRAKPGLFEVANGGTAFLDEVGELPLAAQAKLLRVLETREVTRVGGLKPQTVNVRFVAATNRDLRAEVARGNFREDLFFRLNGAVIALPPLRQRRTEIEPLVRRFVTEFSQQLGRPTPRLSEDALQLLLTYGWPGNIRELRNVVECAALRSDGELINVTDLPPELTASGPQHIERRTSPTTLAPPPIDGQGLTPIQRAERDRIVQALDACHGNQTRAAEVLDMPRRTLVAKLVVYGIPRPRGPSRGPA
jgi:two-component system response regulator AtoC